MKTIKFLTILFTLLLGTAITASAQGNDGTINVTKNDNGTYTTSMPNDGSGVVLTVLNPYAVLKKNGTYDEGHDTYTLTFYCDDNRDNHTSPEEKVFDLPTNDIPGWIKEATTSSDPEYPYYDLTTITKVVFDKSFKDFTPEDKNNVCQWFLNCWDLTEIEGLTNLDVSELTDLGSMFRDCKKLKVLDLTSFNTGNVKDMSMMFSGCKSLTTILVGDNWSTNGIDPDDKYYKTGQMFYKCTKLIGENGAQYTEPIGFDASDNDYFTHANTDGNGYLTKDEAKIFLNYGYKEDGKTKIEKKTYSELSNLTEPTHPDRYDFAGWRGSDGNYYTAIPGTATGNLYYTAEWEVFTATYTENGTETTKKFATLSEALDESNYPTGTDDVKITLEADCTPANTATINISSINFTVDLRGHSMKMRSAELDVPYYVINITGGSLKIDADNDKTEINVAFNVSYTDDNAGKLVINGGLYNILPKDEYDYVIKVDGGDSHLDIYDGEIHGEKNKLYHSALDHATPCAIYSTANNFTVHGGRLLGSGTNSVIYSGTQYKDWIPANSTVKVFKSYNPGNNPWDDPNNVRFTLSKDYFTTYLEYISQVLRYNVSGSGGPIDQLEVEVAPEAYAVFSDDDKTITFYCDNQKANREGSKYDILVEDYNYKWPDGNGWCPDDNTDFTNVTKVVFDQSFKNARPTTCNSLFYSNNSEGFVSLTTIEGIEYLNTSDVTDMVFMFRGCSNLTSLDLSQFDTKKVESMKGMFYGCSSLTELDLSSFNTSAVTDMMYMFGMDINTNASSPQLASITFGENFTTENVTNMNFMFQDCSRLTSLDLSKFNTGKVTGMANMFDGCSGLTTLDLKNFNTSSVTSMDQMFYECSGLTTLDLKNFKTSSVTSMDQMFYGCSGLTAILVDRGKWDVVNVTDDDEMFAGCDKLIGEKGTVCPEIKINNNDYITITNRDSFKKNYAKIDGGDAAPGYLSSKYAVIFVPDDGALPDDYKDGYFYYESSVKDDDYKLDGATYPGDYYPFNGWYSINSKGEPTQKDDQENIIHVTQIPQGTTGNMRLKADWPKKTIKFVLEIKQNGDKYGWTYGDYIHSNDYDGGVNYNPTYVTITKKDDNTEFNDEEKAFTSLFIKNSSIVAQAYTDEDFSVLTPGEYTVLAYVLKNQDFYKNLALIHTDFGESETVKLTIDPKPIFVTVADITKTYDGTTTLPNNIVSINKDQKVSHTTSEGTAYEDVSVELVTPGENDNFNKYPQATAGTTSIMLKVKLTGDNAENYTLGSGWKKETTTTDEGTETVYTKDVTGKITATTYYAGLNASITVPEGLNGLTFKNATSDNNETSISISESKLKTTDETPEGTYTSSNNSVTVIVKDYAKDLFDDFDGEWKSENVRIYPAQIEQSTTKISVGLASSQVPSETVTSPKDINWTVYIDDTELTENTDISSSKEIVYQLNDQYNDIYSRNTISIKIDQDYPNSPCLEYTDGTLQTDKCGAGSGETRPTVSVKEGTQITLYSNDATSGVAKIFYTGKENETGEKPTLIKETMRYEFKYTPTVGVYTLKLNAEDFAGNKQSQDMDLDLTVYHPVTITFNGNGGTLNDLQSDPTETVKYDGSNTTKSYPIPSASATYYTKKGYTFAGWATSAVAKTPEYTFNGTADPQIPIDEKTDDITLYAVWTANSYTITYDTEGGSEVASITKNYGETITAPENPTKEGHSFAGWDKTIPETMPADDLTIKAKWNINQYTITFDTEGGSEVASITKNYGETITAPENPTKEGHSFAGWDKTIPETMPAEDLTIRAKWNINLFSVTLPDYLTLLTTTENNQYQYGSEIKFKVKEDDYEVTDLKFKDNALTADNNGVYTITIPENGVKEDDFKAEVKQKFEIKFIVDGKDVDIKFVKGKTPSYGETNPTKESTTEHSYKFIGWEDGNNIFYPINENGYVELPEVTAATIYTAKFEESVNCMFVVTEGKDIFDTDGKLKPITYDGEDHAEITFEVRSAVKVNGEYPLLSSETDYEITMPDEMKAAGSYDITITSKNATVQTCPDITKTLVIKPRPVKVVIDKDKLSSTYGETVSGDNIVWSVSDETPLVEGESKSNLGLTFNSNVFFIEKADVTEGGYEISASASNSNYTVTFSPELGSLRWTINKADIADIDITAPKAKEGLKYTGQDQPLVEKGSVIGGTMLYSLDGNNWSENVPQGKDDPKYTVYYKVQGDQNHNDLENGNFKVEVTIKNGNTITFHTKYGKAPDALTNVPDGTKITAPTIDKTGVVGYSFSGEWYTDEEFKTEWDFSKGVTSDLNLYAKWEINKHTVTFVVDGSIHSKIENVPFDTKFGNGEGEIKLPEMQDKNGEQFGGWKYDGKDIPDDMTMPDEDITITGHYGDIEPPIISSEIKVNGKDIDITKTQKYECIGNSGEIIITATDNKSGVKKIEMTLKDDNGNTSTKEGLKTGDNTWSFTIEPGTYSIEVTATDEKDNTTSAHVTFEVVIRQEATLNTMEYTYTQLSGKDVVLDGLDLHGATIEKITIDGTNIWNADKNALNSKTLDNVKVGEHKAKLFTLLNGASHDTGKEFTLTVKGFEVSFSQSGEKEGGYCPGETAELTLTFDPMSHYPTHYKIVGIHYSYQSMESLDDEIKKIKIAINDRLPIKDGLLQMQFAYADGNPNTQSEVKTLKVTVKGSSELIIKLFDDLIAINNHDDLYVAYQWYKDGKPIDEANQQYWQCPKNEEIKGVYSAIVTLTDGNTLEICSANFGENLSKSFRRSVNVYPNPAHANEQITLELLHYDENEYDECTIKIVNNAGSVVKTITNCDRINTVALPVGTYTGYVIRNGAQDKVSFKIIVK